MMQTQSLTNCIPGKLSFAILAPIVLFSGCGIHLHRPEDSKVAQSAVDAFKDAKLNETITAEFAASAEILAKEIAAIRRQSNARRDQRLAAFIGGQTKESSWGGLSKYIDDRIKELAGEHADKDPMKEAITQMLTAPQIIYQTFNHLRGTYLSYQATRTHIVPPTDPKIPRIGAQLTEDEAATLSPSVKQVYGDYKRALNKYKAAVKEGSPPSSFQELIGETLSSQIAHEEVLQRVGAAATDAQKKLDGLKRARDAKIAEAEVPGKKAEEISQALKEAAAKTDEATTFLKTITSTTSQAGLPTIQEKITGLQAIRQEIADLLHALSDSLEEKSPTQRDKEKVKVLASVSAIRAGLDAAKYPKVSVLLLESERLRIEIQRLQGLIALEQERKIVLDLKLASLVRELGPLHRAKTRIDKAAGKKAIAEEGDATAELAVDALAYVVESWTAGRTPAEETDFLLAGIDHRAALENSSAAFAQWANLIGVPMSQLLAYHQSGIKSEDLANLINAAGLGAIAGGLY